MTTNHSPSPRELLRKKLLEAQELASAIYGAAAADHGSESAAAYRADEVQTNLDRAFAALARLRAEGTG